MSLDIYNLNLCDTFNCNLFNICFILIIIMFIIILLNQFLYFIFNLVHLITKIKNVKILNKEDYLYQDNITQDNEENKDDILLSEIKIQ